MQSIKKTSPTNRILDCFLALLSVVNIIGLAAGCNSRRHPKPTAAAEKPQLSAIPFSLAVVPGRRGIVMARNKPDEFYVLLRNISEEPQAVWEFWNSWGYQTISFELITTDGKKFVVSKRQEVFTQNFPSTFLIEPGEYQVYAIRLDNWWETKPPLPKVDKMSITLKAIYEVSPTPEAAQYKVWTGRIESHDYKLALIQW